jgi:hypothetical protein
MAEPTQLSVSRRRSVFLPLGPASIKPWRAARHGAVDLHDAQMNVEHLALGILAFFPVSPRVTL